VSAAISSIHRRHACHYNRLSGNDQCVDTARPEITLALRPIGTLPGLLNHGYKAKIQHTEKDSAHENKIDARCARAGPRKEKDTATLRLLFR
jgi:hypothetical protein